MAGCERAKGRPSSLAIRSPRVSSSTIARRVGSASAAKAASKWEAWGGMGGLKGDEEEQLGEPERPGDPERPLRNGRFGTALEVQIWFILRMVDVQGGLGRAT